MPWVRAPDVRPCEKMETMQVKTHVQKFRPCVSVQVWTQALEVSAQIVANLAPDARTYALLINACRKRAKHLIPSLVVEAESKVTLSESAYREAIRTQQLASQWQQVMQLFFRMEAAQLCPDARLYQMVLRSIGKKRAAGAWEYGVALLARAEQQGLVLDEATRNRVVGTVPAHAREKAQDWLHPSRNVISNLGCSICRKLP